ncbi:MAG: hypothetical protein IPG06_22385 [Haliea sp.]|nr:hypothetical protein [Haliea sp.]
MKWVVELPPLQPGDYKRFAAGDHAVNAFTTAAFTAAESVGGDQLWRPAADYPTATPVKR